MQVGLGRPEGLVNIWGKNEESATPQRDPDPRSTELQRCTLPRCQEARIGEFWVGDEVIHLVGTSFSSDENCLGATEKVLA